MVKINIYKAVIDTFNDLSMHAFILRVIKNSSGVLILGRLQKKKKKP